MEPVEPSKPVPKKKTKYKTSKTKGTGRAGRGKARSQTNLPVISTKLSDNCEDVLNAKQLAFCEEYLVDFNKNRAFQVAYYPGEPLHAHRSIGARNLLKLPKVTDYIQKQIKERSMRLHITQDDVVRELWYIVQR